MSNQKLTRIDIGNFLPNTILNGPLWGKYIELRYLVFPQRKGLA